MLKKSCRFTKNFAIIQGMHNEFYASGFLYHSASQQILLQQYPSLSQPSMYWSLFGGMNQTDETSEQAFLRILAVNLGLTVTPNACFAVYDYVQKNRNTPRFIYYAIVDTLYDEEALLTENKTSWFSFKQVAKLPIEPQTRQDITVGQRVINLAVRQLQPRA